MSQFQPSGFSVLPNVVKNLIIINVLFFLGTLASQSLFDFDLNDMLGLHYLTSSKFMPHQLFTYMFMHGGFEHLFFNMFALWMFGSTLENIWGAKKFLFYYLICGIGAALVQEGVWYFRFDDIMNYEFVRTSSALIPARDYIDLFVTIGASGSVFGLLLAFGMMFPETKIYLYFFVPIKTKWFVIGYGLIELMNGVFGRGGDVAHFAHLGGMLFGLALILYWKKRNRLY